MSFAFSLHWAHSYAIFGVRRRILEGPPDSRPFVFLPNLTQPQTSFQSFDDPNPSYPHSSGHWLNVREGRYHSRSRSVPNLLSFRDRNYPFPIIRQLGAMAEPASDAPNLRKYGGFGKKFKVREISSIPNVTNPSPHLNRNPNLLLQSASRRDETSAMQALSDSLINTQRQGRFSGQIRRSPQAAKFPNARFSRSQSGNAGTASAVKRITSRMWRLTLE